MDGMQIITAGSMRGKTEGAAVDEVPRFMCVSLNRWGWVCLLLLLLYWVW